MRKLVPELRSVRLNVRFILIMMISLYMSTMALAQLPTAQQVSSQMKVGWNLGNTLESICSETAWNGGVVTTQALIDKVKASGFNTVRLPVSWDCHATNGVIDPAWLARVKQVVDYCINDNLYVIVNIHWITAGLIIISTPQTSLRLSRSRKITGLRLPTILKTIMNTCFLRGQMSLL